MQSGGRGGKRGTVSYNKKIYSTPVDHKTYHTCCESKREEGELHLGCQRGVVCWEMVRMMSRVMLRVGISWVARGD